MRILDRSLFKKKVSLAAARVYENNQISRLRTELRKELLDLEKVSSVKPDPQDQNAVSGRKVLLLKPEIRPNRTTINIFHVLAAFLIACRANDLGTQVKGAC